MIEPKDKFAKILSDLENEIKDPHDLEIAKNKLLEVSLMFIDITNRAMDNSNQYDMLAKKIDTMQKSLKRIEEDIYIDEDEDNEDDEYNLGDQMHDNDINLDDEFEFEIKCPYCNYEFVVGQDADLKDEIECPKCHKEIELDWDDYCDGECDHCASLCYNADLENQDDEKYNESSSQDENYVAEDSVQYDVSDETENDDLTNNKNQIGSNQNIINEQPKSKSNNTQNQNGQNKQGNNQNNQANNMKNEGIKEEQNNQINENEDDM